MLVLVVPFVYFTLNRMWAQPPPVVLEVGLADAPLGDSLDAGGQEAPEDSEYAQQDPDLSNSLEDFLSEIGDP